MARKVYVEVIARFDTMATSHRCQLNGKTERYMVIDKRRSASLKAGGIGMRYTCRILNQQSYLFYEEPRWFVEAKNGY